MVNTGDTPRISVLANADEFQIRRHNSTHPNRFDAFLEIEDDVFNYSIPRKVVFVLYRNTELFRVTGRARLRGEILRYVVTASIPGKVTDNLPRVVLRYPVSKKRSSGSKSHCVSWSFKENNGRGDWWKEGCEFHGTEKHEECRCNRLGNIALIQVLCKR